MDWDIWGLAGYFFSIITPFIVIVKCGIVFTSLLLKLLYGTKAADTENYRKDKPVVKLLIAVITVILYGFFLRYVLYDWLM